MPPLPALRAPAWKRCWPTSARITGQAAESARGGAWVEGDLHRDALNLESRLASACCGRWPTAPTATSTTCTLARASTGPLDHARADAARGRQRQRSPLQSLNFAALRIKDAVCDTLREATGARPSVDTRHPDLPLVLFVGPEHATLYVDTSGEALFKRGWRDARGGSQGDKGEAPLKETLAAAMLAAAGWQGRAEDGPLLDPCCGAGTIAIEAAQIACGIAPGRCGRFAFERHAALQPLRAAWRELQRPRGARACARGAGVRRRRELSHDRLRHPQRRTGRRGARHRVQDRRRAAAHAAGGRAAR
jgi:putative N6-adenine-specific DNA methylase